MNPGLLIPLLAAAAAPPAAAAHPTAPAAAPVAAPSGPFASIELPDWAFLEAPPRERTRPWILIADDAQCPYCMQLHLALVKARDNGDREIRNALIARFPFPLPIHDQAFHIAVDAYCIEARRDRYPGGAARYLDWLMIDSWRSEPGWEKATIASLGEDGGFFDEHYVVHKVLSSRRREYQTNRAREEAACVPGGCGDDGDCAELCTKQTECRAACPVEGTPQAAGEGRTACLDDCKAKFVSARHRSFARDHQDCLLEEGENSAHGRIAAAFAWAEAHDLPGTPTVYVGHPLIGWKDIGDADDLAGALALLPPHLAEARAALAKTTGRPQTLP